MEKNKKVNLSTVIFITIIAVLLIAVVVLYLHYDPSQKVGTSQGNVQQQASNQYKENILANSENNNVQEVEIPGENASQYNRAFDKEVRFNGKRTKILVNYKDKKTENDMQTQTVQVLYGSKEILTTKAYYELREEDIELKTIKSEDGSKEYLVIITKFMRAPTGERVCAYIVNDKGENIYKTLLAGPTSLILAEKVLTYYIHDDSIVWHAYNDNSYNAEHAVVSYKLTINADEDWPNVTVFNTYKASEIQRAGAV